MISGGKPMDTHGREDLFFFFFFGCYRLGA